VALVARRAELLAEQAQRIGGGAVGIPADLADPNGPAHAVSEAISAFGGLDLLVVNAGGPPPGRFDQITEEAWSASINGVLLMAVRLIRAGLPYLSESKRGSILVGLSSNVREPIPALVTSNTLRPGIVGLIKSLVPEIAPVRINGLAPGRVATARIEQLDGRRAQDAGVSVDDIRQQTIDRIPLGRYGDPGDVGRVAAFLLSPAAGYMTGAVIPVDGGMIRSLP
jgi:3-oxoacyl-[acyl-carrier protein] reductase